MISPTLGNDIGGEYFRHQGRVESLQDLAAEQQRLLAEKERQRDELVRAQEPLTRSLEPIQRQEKRQAIRMCVSGIAFLGGAIMSAATARPHPSGIRAALLCAGLTAFVGGMGGFAYSIIKQGSLDKQGRPLRNQSLDLGLKAEELSAEIEYLRGSIQFTQQSVDTNSRTLGVVRMAAQTESGGSVTVADAEVKLGTISVPRNQT